MSASVERVPLLGLLALLPVLAYVLDVSGIVVLAMVNVLLITGALLVMFGATSAAETLAPDVTPRA